MAVAKLVPASKKDIAKLGKGIKTNRQAIQTLSGKVDDNRQAIQTLSGKVDDNRQAIQTLSGKVDKNKYELENRIDDLDEKFERMLVNFRDEILNHIDPVMKELEATRSEQIIAGQQLDDHEKRISHLETTSA